MTDQYKVGASNWWRQSYCAAIVWVNYQRDVGLQLEASMTVPAQNHPPRSGTRLKASDVDVDIQELRHFLVAAADCNFSEVCGARDVFLLAPFVVNDRGNVD